MAEALLVARGIVKSFGGLQVLTGLDVTVRSGEILALIGPNGAGKTTLFDILCGALTPDAGRVEFTGRDITRLPQHEVARLGVGRSFQDVRLFAEMSVADNVAVYAQGPRSQNPFRALLMPWAQRADERAVAMAVRRALDRLGLAALAGRPAGELSYAQQKLVALARLVASDARVLLLDEPASGLDGEERAMIVDAVRQLAGDGMTVCVVEHNMDIVRALADRVSFLAEGRCLAEGSPDEVFAASALAEIYFGGGARAKG